MAHYLELLLPAVDADPDMVQADLEAQIQWHLNLQRRLTKFVQTGQDLDYFEDFLAQEGCDPFEFWAAAEENLALFERADQPLDGGSLILV